MQTMGFLLLLVSSAFSISLVALGLSVVGRCLGVVPLEILPLGIGVSLACIALAGPKSPSTMSALDLLPLLCLCAAALFCMHPLYMEWRKRLGGESITLMFSFAIMSCWNQAMSISTEAKSISLSFPDVLEENDSRMLKIAVLAVALAVLSVLVLTTRRRGRVAALQLSLDDSNLLATFGISARRCQRLVIALSILLVTFGSALYICLQQNFSFQNSFDIIVPAFAISLSQIRLRVSSTILISLVLLSGIEYLTYLSPEATLREGNQAVLFAVIVTSTLAFRRGRASGRFASIERHWKRLVHVA
jgi:branched-subunit amino acid ABC-type transport system permease component